VPFGVVTLPNAGVFLHFPVYSGSEEGVKYR
jgi:hypothetical protein